MTVVVEVNQSDCIAGLLVPRLDHQLEFDRSSEDVYIQEMEEGQIEWLKGWAEGMNDKKLLSKWSTSIKKYGGRQNIKMHPAVMISGEGILRVGDIATFTPSGNSRPYVGRVEALFEVQPAKLDEDDTWPLNGLVEALWVSMQQDERTGQACLKSEYYRGIVFKHNKDGTYHIKFEDGDEVHASTHV
jgi:hypothetical protein